MVSASAHVLIDNLPNGRRVQISTLQGFGFQQDGKQVGFQLGTPPMGKGHRETLLGTFQARNS